VRTAVVPILLGWLGGILAPALAVAGMGAHNLALVVNPRDPDSLTIGNHYIHLRNIPPENVFEIPWTPNTRMSHDLPFREKFLQPLLAAIEDRGLTQQIHGVALSCGYPYMIDFRNTLDANKFPRVATPVTSLTSAVFFHAEVLAKQPGFLGSNANPYFTPTINGVTTTRSFSPTAILPPSPPEGSPQPRHLLTVSLGFTYGRGNTVEEILNYLSRSQQADGTRPPGTVYYMQNQNVRSKTRDSSYPAAVKELLAAGVKAEVGNGVAPRGKADVMGLTTGAVHVRLPEANCTLLPGCLIDNLTSAGGQLFPQTNPNQQTPVSAYLRDGAAGASGAVIEPYAIAAKFPSAALHVHYARGSTMAEAFYQSTQSPFQLLLVGDPLCRPWASRATVKLDGISEYGTVQGNVELQASATQLENAKFQRFELYLDGQFHSETADGRFQVDSTGLDDGWHEVRLVAIDDTPVEGQTVGIGSLRVKNGNDAVQLKPPAGDRIRYGEALPMGVVGTGNQPITLWHNGREIGSTPGPRGTIRVETSQLGKGQVRLQARQGGTPAVRSTPVVLTVY
jgi:hypothetical protein